MATSAAYEVPLFVVDDLYVIDEITFHCCSIVAPAALEVPLLLMDGPDVAGKVAFC